MMIFEFLPQISLLVFMLALIGYISKYFYNIGYYRYAYNPSSQKSLEQIFNNCSFGVILIFLGILFFSFSLGADTSLIPDEIKSIPISQVTLNNFIIYTYLLSLLMSFILLISFFSFMVGFFFSFGMAKAIHVKTKDEDISSFHVREVYSENEDFIFYLTLDGKWGSIRKSYVQMMEEIKMDSRYQTWIKKDKKNKYYVIFAVLLYVLFVVYYNFV